MGNFKRLCLVFILLIVNCNQVYAEPEVPIEENQNEVPEDASTVPEEGMETETTPLTEEAEQFIQEETERVNQKYNENQESNTSKDQEKEIVIDQSKRETEIVKKPMDTPSSVTGEKYNGSGTVIDFTTTGAKAFYTVQTPDNNIFYIVIDMDKTENNVYFLSELNQEELALSEVVTPKSEEPVKVETPTKIEDPKKESSNSMFWLFSIIAGFGFLSYHLFYGKLKNMNPLLNKKAQEKKPTDNGPVDTYNDKAVEGYVNDTEDGN